MNTRHVDNLRAIEQSARQNVLHDPCASSTLFPNTHAQMCCGLTRDVATRLDADALEMSIVLAANIAHAYRLASDSGTHVSLSKLSHRLACVFLSNFLVSRKLGWMCEKLEPRRPRAP